ncbi:hypothetical protein AGMMS49944_28570 [Spirochaetia bacterium]|nr:hypothetical protein AGMMS49944_28570 [Spirochaetia bacterium]
MIHKVYGNTVQLLGQNLLNVDLPWYQVKEIDIDEIESLSDGKPCNEGSFKAGKQLIRKTEYKYASIAGKRIFSFPCGFN